MSDEEPTMTLEEQIMRLEDAFCSLVEVVAGGNANDLFNRAEPGAGSAASAVLDAYWVFQRERE